MAEGEYQNSITISGYADCNAYTDNSTWRYDYYHTEKDERIEKLQTEYLQDYLGEHKKSKKIEGVDIMNLYDVYLVYAEDRKDPVVIPVFGVIANSDEDAQIKSGLMKKVEDDWDADYLTFIVKLIGNVKVKEKVKEVKQVK